MPRRRIRNVLLISAVLVAAWLACLGTAIWRFGAVDHAVRSDCIIVLGAAAKNGVPSPVFEERLRHGVALYQRGLADRLLLTGGIGDGAGISESRTGREWAIARGVPAPAILIEEKSRTTRENLEEAASLMRAGGLRSAIVVSDPLHLKRAVAMARDLGIGAVSSPTPTTRYRSLAPKLGFLLRELYFLHHYWLMGQ